MLLIVDIQKDFEAASLRALPEIIKQVKQAKRNKEFIVLLRYGAGNKSLQRLTKHLKGCKYLKVNKSSDDGGADIFYAISRLNNNLNSPPHIHINRVKNIKVCGVNTSACVMSTVRTLTYLRIPITVISEACANVWDKFSEEYNLSHHKGALRRMGKWKNVEVI